MSYQRKVAELIRGAFGLGPDDCKSTPAGVNGPDLTLSTLGQKLFPYSLELKYCKTVSVPAWLRQAGDGAYPETMPIVGFHSFEQKEDYVIIPLRHFVELAAPDILRRCAEPDTEDGTSCTPKADHRTSRRMCGPTFARQSCLGGS